MGERAPLVREASGEISAAASFGARLRRQRRQRLQATTILTRCARAVAANAAAASPCVGCRTPDSVAPVRFWWRARCVCARHVGGAHPALPCAGANKRVSLFDPRMGIVEGPVLCAGNRAQAGCSGASAPSAGGDAVSPAGRARTIYAGRRVHRFAGLRCAAGAMCAAPAWLWRPHRPATVCALIAQSVNPPRGWQHPPTPGAVYLLSCLPRAHCLPHHGC